LKPSSTDDSWLEGGPRSLKWPRPLVYEHKSGSKNAALFLAQRRRKRSIANEGKLVVSDGQLYSLGADGLWAELSEAALMYEIRKTDPSHVLDVSDIDRMVKAIHIECFTHARPFDWLEPREGDPAPRNLILFRNGRLDFASGTFTKHDGRYFATAAPSFDYDQFEICPTWDRCLNQWLPGDKASQDCFHEFAGYLMTADTRLEKFLCMIGTGRSGKTTAARVLEWLCGVAHCMSVTLDDLGGPFGLEGSIDKRMMLIPDAHDTHITKRSTALGRIKGIVGRDAQGVNRKNIKAVARVVLLVRIVMTANRHPAFIDESNALGLRELLLGFNVSFAGKEDRNLSIKLQRELSGIANRALDGLARLRRNKNVFTTSPAMTAAAEQLRRDLSPAFDFATSCLTVTNSEDDFIPDAALYRLYTDWAKEKGIKGRLVRTCNALKGDLIAAFGAGVRHTQRRVNVDRYGFARRVSVRTHGLSGIKRPVDRLPSGMDRGSFPEVPRL
jgi:P4 family phage/plasmid primase-like protien